MHLQRGLCSWGKLNTQVSKFSVQFHRQSHPKKNWTHLNRLVAFPIVMDAPTGRVLRHKFVNAMWAITGIQRMSSVCHGVRVVVIMVIVLLQRNAHAMKDTHIMQPKVFVYLIVTIHASMVNALIRINVNVSQAMCFRMVPNMNVNRCVNCPVRMANALSRMYASVIVDLWWPTTQNRTNATAVNIV